MRLMPWDAVIERVRAAQRFVVTTHLHADGDGLGAELAMARYLKAEGKQVRIINPDPVPSRYLFLDPLREIEVWRPEAGEAAVATDVALVLDISKWDRLGGMADALKRAAATRICIDHHPFEGGFGDLDLINDKAAATGEIVHELLQRMGARLTPEIHEALYVAVLTDTGRFRFSNTTPRSLEIAADAHRAGVRPDRVHALLFEGFSEARMRLVGRLLTDLRLECDGRLAHFTVTQAALAESGATEEETEGLVDYPRTIRGVVVVVFFLETRDGGSKVSLRSSSDEIHVNALASRFGGGGHAKAAGLLLGESPEKMREIVLDAVRALF
jgi:phosphoesterase RecJ-like protein